MPVFKFFDGGTGEEIMRYKTPMFYPTPTDEIIDILYDLRKKAVKEEEYHRAEINLHDDREMKRWCKEEMKKAGKIVKAVNFHLGYFGDNKQKDIPVNHWPIDLCKELDYVGFVIALL